MYLACCVYMYLQEELSLVGYRRHQESQQAAPPLSHAELALKELHENEVQYMFMYVFWLDAKPEQPAASYQLDVLLVNWPSGHSLYSYMYVVQLNNGAV